MLKSFAAILFTLLASSPLMAKDARLMMTSGEGCELNQTVSLSINFNGNADKAVDVREKMDNAISRVTELAEKQGVKGMKIQSQSYNLNANSGYENGAYQYSGNVQFNLKSSDKVFVLMDKLKEQRIMASLNVNEYQQGTCQ